MSSSEQDHLQTVQQIYADFAQGRIPAILARLSRDVTWINAGPSTVPYARERRGIDAVQSFFGTLAASVEVQAFEPLEYFAHGDRVVVLGRWAGRALPTGRSFASDWAMAWTLRDARVTAFRSYEDTHVLAAAFAA